MKPRAPFRYWGSKVQMAPWIVPRLPTHRHFIEACAGSAAVMAVKPPAEFETVNDVYGEVVNFFRVLREPRTAAELIDRVTFTPYARAEMQHCFELLAEGVGGPVERAWAFFVCMQMAVVPGKPGWSYGVNAVSAAQANKPGRWATMPALLQACAIRFERVQVDQRDILELIDRYDDPDTLFLVDPPYLDETRPNSVGRQSAYVHDEFDHRAFLEKIPGCKAMFAVTHYPTGLYDDVPWSMTDDFESHRNIPNTERGEGRDQQMERLYVWAPGRDAEHRLFTL